MGMSQIYSVMNDDHAELCRIVEQLRDASKRCAKTEDAKAEVHKVCLGLIDKLIQETTAHFRREEGLMKRYKYKMARQHEMDHLVLLRTIQNMRLGLQNNTTTFSPETVAYIKNWLVRHIAGSDKHLATFLLGCEDKRTIKRKDLSTKGKHPLSFLFSMFDTVTTDVVSSNRTLGAGNDARKAYQTSRMHDPAVPNKYMQEKRQQYSVWYE